MDTSTGPIASDSARPTPPRRPPPTPANVRRAAWAGLVGTALEQYDFVIYGTASALVFSKLFFPNISPVAGSWRSFAAYAVGFVARPLGGLFFSHFGDRLGRKWVLVTTLFLMGAATFAHRAAADLRRQVGLLAPAAARPVPLLPGLRRRRRTGRRCHPAHRDRAGRHGAAGSPRSS